VSEHSRDQRDEHRPEDAPREAETHGEEEGEELDEVGRESFPASDPPASWAGPPDEDSDDRAGG
jgi:hypothetical protein